MTDNKSVFSTVEFNSWADRSQLINAERFLIERYLEKSASTLEAGTGGGKILFEMKASGFERLFGFDFVPEFIEHARRKDVSDSISFEVADAVNLKYQDWSFDQIIYLQQVLCFINDGVSRLAAISEAYRVLKPGGTALFSFLSFDARANSYAYWPYLTYLYALRNIRGRQLTLQHSPWLKLGGKFNPNSIADKGPYVYWYKAREICDLLCDAGFRIAAVGSGHQIERGKMCESLEDLEREPIKGMLYVVCHK